MKLIKIDNHYYVVDDSEIKENDFVHHPEVSQEYTIVQGEKYSKGYHIAQGVYKHKPTTNEWYKKERKITHSTQPLENVILLNLADVEEAINGYSIEKMAEETAIKNWENSDLYKDAPVICMTAINAEKEAFIKGFKACQELMKDKMFTASDMLNAYREGTNTGACHESLMDYESHDSTDAEEFSKSASEEFENSLLPKIEWEINIIDDKIIIL